MKVIELQVFSFCGIAFVLTRDDFLAIGVDEAELISVFGDSSQSFRKVVYNLIVCKIQHLIAVFVYKSFLVYITIVEVFKICKSIMEIA